MLLFISAVDQCLTCRRATLLERALVAVRAGQLDQALAAGASPDASALLSLRAQQLVHPDVRRELGGTVRVMVRDAWEPLPPRPALTAEAHQNAVRRYAETLGQLADCLLAPAPVSAIGMARAFLLITQANGPLCYPPDSDELGACIQAAIEALDPLATW